jgi:hypothetical protein
MGRDRIDELRAAITQLDDAVRDAELIRTHLARQRSRPPFWPDRRSPKRWERNSAHQSSSEEEPALLAAGEPEFAGE